MKSSFTPLDECCLDRLKWIWHDMYQNHSAVLGIETLPTMYDLPSEDPEEMGLPDEFQPKLLRETFQFAERLFEKFYLLRS
jgi:hypothetical protein